MTKTAFVLGGGGLLGAVQVGMLRALLEAGITPDLVVGSSVGALNGAAVAAAPQVETVAELGTLWQQLGQGAVFGEGPLARFGTLVRSGTHVHSSRGLRSLLADRAGDLRIEDLPVQFECVAACIETASAHWFTQGSLVDAVVASCSVPGLFPPARIDGRHYLDGGLVHSIPVGRALQLGATTVFVLQVGRIEQPLTVPRRPWEVGMVAFEIARRSRFLEEMAAVETDREVVLLPTGTVRAPLANLKYRSVRQVSERIESAYQASAELLAGRRQS